MWFNTEKIIFLFTKIAKSPNFKIIIHCQYKILEYHAKISTLLCYLVKKYKNLGTIQELKKIVWIY